MDAIVYTTRACQACTLTVKALQSQGVTVYPVALEDSPRAQEFVREMGYTQAPVVLTGDRSWSGFRPEAIKAAGQR